MDAYQHPDHISVDVVIIGAGSAGMVAYKAAKDEGASVLLCDPGPLGTTCARVGCMPSKLLIAAAEGARTARKVSAFGVHVGEVSVDGRAVLQRVRDERDRFAGFSVRSVQSSPPEEYLPHSVYFTGPNTLVSSAGHTIEAEAIVIATGTRPLIPPPLDNLKGTLVTTDAVFEISELPKRLAVVGAGAIGLELAQAFSALGVDVTLFNRGTSLGSITDPVVLETYRSLLTDDVRLLERAPLVAASESQGQATLTWSAVDGSTPSDTFDLVLAATGRIPNVEYLQLGNANIELQSRGRFTFDPATLHVPGTSIFVAGDINGWRNILHEAVDDGQIAGENAARLAAGSASDVRKYQRRESLNIIYSHPQLGSGGASFDELNEDEFVVGEVSLRNQGRSRIELENQGVLRVYAAKDDGRLLGFEILSQRAEHIAHQLAWAIQSKLDVRQMLDLPFYHPAVEEGLRSALQRAIKQLALPPRTRIPLAEDDTTQA